MKILVADDSKTNLALITFALNKLGHTVIGVESGKDAIEKFKTNRPDLVILDVVMSETDGFECARQLRALDENDWIPIIFLSGAVDDEDIQHGIDAGGDDYLTKPFSEITLAAKIKAMQRISDMRQKLYETTQQLKILSTTDSLTGIANRFSFEKMMIAKVKKAKKHHQEFALLILDVDNFKLINDTLGHQIGDQLLKQIANRIKKCIEPVDFIARMGGDEFAIIINEVNGPHDAGLISQKIMDSLSDTYDLMGNDVNTTVSIGIACFPIASEEVSGLIRASDVALYHAKSLGRSNYQYFTEELNKKHKREMQLEHDLKFVLDRNELFLLYQPIINLETQEITTLEVLVCWKHPILGLIKPNVFISLAEEMGLITPIGNWVIEQALQEINNVGCENIKLAFNLSSRQLLQKSLSSVLKNSLSIYQMDPGSIDLEITEFSVITHSNFSQRNIAELKKLGVNFSVNNFGAEYSSFIHLRKFPVSTLKIEKTFVREALSNSSDAELVISVINLGKNLGMNVTGCGVETKEQLDFLIRNQCPQAQGYYIAKPQDISKVKKLLDIRKIPIFSETRSIK